MTGFRKAPSLRVRVVLLVLFALLPALVLLVHRGRVERQIVDEQTRATALRSAQIAAIEEERLTEGIRQLLSMAALLVETAGSEFACTRLFPQMIEDDPRLADVGVIGADGRLQCSAAKERPRELGGHDFFRAALGGSFAIGAYERDAGHGEPTVGFGMPIVEGERPAGVVFATIRLAWLRPMLERANLPDGASILVLDARGTLLARSPAAPLASGETAMDVALVQDVLARKEGTAIAKGLDGIFRIFGFTLVPRGEDGAGIHVIVGLPLEATFAAVDYISRRDLLVLLAVALLTTGSAWLGGTLLVRPLRSLVRTTSRLRRGELAARVGGVGGPAEFRLLADSFDAMAESLERTTGRLRNRADELGAVATAARALVDDQSLEAVAAVVVAQAQLALEAKTSALWIVDGDELRLLAARGFRTDTSGIEHMSRDTPAAAAVAWRTRTVVRIDDTSACEFDDDAARQHAHAEGLRTILAMPLQFRGQIVAVLALGHAAPSRFDGAEPTRLIAALGDLFAAAVQNAQLFEQVRSELWLRESFIAAAAHELRSPATSLKTATTLLQRRLAHDAAEKPVVNRLVRIADRTTALARDLVEVHEMLGGTVLEKSEVDVLALVKKATSEVEALRPGRKMELDLEPASMRVDGRRLLLAVRALLELAFRYQPGAGAVSVRLERRPNEVRIEIVDQGPGFPPERIGHVFEPLFEPWPPGSPHYIGIVGLGPFLARLVVEGHGGRLEVASAPQVGTTTTICLPA